MLSLSDQIKQVLVRVASEFKALATVAKTNQYSDLDGIPKFATQEQAESGTDETTIMSPKQVKNAIAKNQTAASSIAFTKISLWEENPVDIFNSFYNPVSPTSIVEEEPVSQNSIGLPEVGITGI